MMIKTFIERALQYRLEIQTIRGLSDKRLKKLDERREMTDG